MNYRCGFYRLVSYLISHAKVRTRSIILIQACCDSFVTNSYLNAVIDEKSISIMRPEASECHMKCDFILPSTFSIITLAHSNRYSEEWWIKIREKVFNGMKLHEHFKYRWQNNSTFWEKNGSIAWQIDRISCHFQPLKIKCRDGCYANNKFSSPNSIDRYSIWQFLRENATSFEIENRLCKWNLMNMFHMQTTWI